VLLDPSGYTSYLPTPTRKDSFESAQALLKAALRKSAAVDRGSTDTVTHARVPRSSGDLPYGFGTSVVRDFVQYQ